jgi:hypothetical protein
MTHPRDPNPETCQPDVPEIIVCASERYEQTALIHLKDGPVFMLALVRDNGSLGFQYLPFGAISHKNQPITPKYARPKVTYSIAETIDRVSEARMIFASDAFERTLKILRDLGALTGHAELAILRQRRATLFEPVS